MWHKTISFLVHHTKFLYSIFILHISSMFNFFVVVLETKKLNSSFTHLYIPKQLLRASLERCSYYLDLM